MKSISIFTSLFFIIFLISSCNPSSSTSKDQTTISSEEIKIAKGLIQNSFDDLWAGMDSTKILDYHTEDFYILENGEVWTNQEIRNFMKKNLDLDNLTYRKNRMDFLTIEKHGEAINIAYNNYATFSRNDSVIAEAQWLESALAIPTPQGWRLRMMHSTWIPQEK